MIELPPLMEGHRQAQTRTANPTLSFLREIALAIEGEGELGKSVPASEMLKVASRHGIELTGVNVNATTDEEIATSYRVLGSKLAPVFSGTSDVEIDGFKIFRTEDMRERDGGRGPIREYRYQFTKPKHRTASA